MCYLKIPRTSHLDIISHTIIKSFRFVENFKSFNVDRLPAFYIFDATTSSFCTTRTCGVLCPSSLSLLWSQDKCGTTSEDLRSCNRHRMAKWPTSTDHLRYGFLKLSLSWPILKGVVVGYACGGINFEKTNHLLPNFN